MGLDGLWWDWTGLDGIGRDWMGLMGFGGIGWDLLGLDGIWWDWLGFSESILVCRGLSWYGLLVGFGWSQSAKSKALRC